LVGVEESPPLSPRLRQTLTALLEGDSEKQTARRLRLSVNTVHEYVTALYRHFGVASRAELLAPFLRRFRPQERATRANGSASACATCEEARLHDNLGTALFGKGRLDKAIASDNKATEIDPKDAPAHHDLGAVLCNDKKDYDGAKPNQGAGQRVRQAGEQGKTGTVAVGEVGGVGGRRHGDQQHGPTRGREKVCLGTRDTAARGEVGKTGVGVGPDEAADAVDGFGHGGAPLGTTRPGCTAVAQGCQVG